MSSSLRAPRGGERLGIFVTSSPVVPSSAISGNTAPRHVPPGFRRPPLPTARTGAVASWNQKGVKTSILRRNTSTLNRRRDSRRRRRDRRSSARAAPRLPPARYVPRLITSNRVGTSRRARAPRFAGRSASMFAAHAPRCRRRDAGSDERTSERIRRPRRCRHQSARDLPHRQPTRPVAPGTTPARQRAVGRRSTPSAPGPSNPATEQRARGGLPARPLAAR